MLKLCAQVKSQLLLIHSLCLRSKEGFILGQLRGKGYIINRIKALITSLHVKMFKNNITVLLWNVLMNEKTDKYY